MAEKQDRRGFFLPVARDEKTGEFRLAMPRIMDEIASAFSMPGDVYQGKVDPMSPEGMDRAMSLATMVVPGSRIGLGSAESLASRSTRIYNPPKKPPRPIEADYPGGVPVDDAGRITHDIEGRPLAGAHIVGRRMVRGGDEALSPAEYGAVTEGSIGKVPAPLAQGELPRGSVGAYREVRGVEGPERSIGFLRTLDPASAAKVTAHEMGHMIDELSSKIPIDGLNTELRQVYNTLNTGQERTRHLTGPQHVGYSGEDVPRELMVEAIRAYMADPNYLKTVAPKTAARIRASVNDNPRLKDTIQFNALAPLAVGGLGAVLADQQKRRPPEPGTQLQRALARQ